jgi:hypothetical protein
MFQPYGMLTRKYTEPAMAIIGELINSHLIDPIIYDNELFGTLICLQNTKSNMVKTCLDQQTAIEDRIMALTRRQLTSKSSIDGIREMSRTTVMLWELACLGEQGSKIYEFQRKMISYLRSRTAIFSTEADRSRILKQCDKIDDAIAASGSMSLDQFFNNLSDCFGDELFSSTLSSPGPHREVAFIADATCDHLTQEKNRKNGSKDHRTLDPKDQLINDLKSKIGTLVKHIRESDNLKIGQDKKGRPYQQKGTSRLEAARITEVVKVGAQRNAIARKNLRDLLYQNPPRVRRPPRNSPSDPKTPTARHLEKKNIMVLRLSWRKWMMILQYPRWYQLSTPYLCRQELLLV